MSAVPGKLPARGLRMFLLKLLGATLAAALLAAVLVVTKATAQGEKVHLSGNCTSCTWHVSNTPGPE